MPPVLLNNPDTNIVIIWSFIHLYNKCAKYSGSIMQFNEYNNNRFIYAKF